jgi:hypothetical protein
MKMVLVFFLSVLPLAGQSKQKTESFWDKVLRITGVSATPSSLRGESNAGDGDIWITAATANAAPQRLTEKGGYSSPVFEVKRRSVLALKGGDLYRVSLNGESPARLRSLIGISKLVGTSRDEADQLLVLIKDARGRTGAALLSIQTGAITSISYDPQSKEDEVMLAHLAGWERVFGDVRLYCEDNEQEGAGGSTIRFSDVYLKHGSNPPINLSNGKGVSSCEPSLSPDGERVVFIRGSR